MEEPKKHPSQHREEEIERAYLARRYKRFDLDRTELRKLAFDEMKSRGAIIGYESIATEEQNNRPGMIEAYFDYQDRIDEDVKNKGEANIQILSYTSKGEFERRTLAARFDPVHVDMGSLPQNDFYYHVRVHLHTLREKAAEYLGYSLIERAKAVELFAKNPGLSLQELEAKDATLPHPPPGVFNGAPPIDYDLGRARMQRENDAAWAKVLERRAEAEARRVEKNAAHKAEQEEHRKFLAARYNLPNANIYTLRDHAAAELGWKPGELREATNSQLVLQLKALDQRRATAALSPSPTPATSPTPSAPSISAPDWITSDPYLDLMLYVEKLVEVFGPFRSQGKSLDEAIKAMRVKPVWCERLTAEDLIPCVEPHFTSAKGHGWLVAVEKLLHKLGLAHMSARKLSKKLHKHKNPKDESEESEGDDGTGR